MYYDKPLARWVPWGPPALSSDGLTYAYVDGDQTRSRVHLVDVRTERDTQLAEGGPWRLVGLAPEGIYLMRIEYVDTAAYGLMAFGHGLWQLPLTGGVADQLTSDTRSWTLGPGAAWGGGSTMDDAGGPNDIIRFDLKTKQSTVWFAPGKRSRVLGTDGLGIPLIMSEAADVELWMVPTPDTRVEIWSGPTNGPRPWAPVAFDGGTIWFSSANMARTWNIFRYTGTGLEVMADFSDHPVTVAGPCA